jgi:hypothetical protein
MIKVPLGWDVYNAVLAPRLGVWVQTSGNFWNTNDRYASYPGYNGWGGTQHQSYHDAFSAQLITMACGSTSGKNVAVLFTDTTNYAWGTEYRDGLTRIGGLNITLFAGSSGGWRGCDPRDFDVVIGAINGSDYHPVTNVYGNITTQAIDLCKNYACRFISSYGSITIDDLKADFGIGVQVTYTPSYWVTSGWNPGSATPPHPRHVFQEAPFAGGGIGMISYTDHRLEDGFTPASGSVTIYHSTYTSGVPQGEGLVAVWRS